MRIVFDAATIHQSRRGSVTGVVYFDFGDNLQFPGVDWNDFIVVIARWWLSAMAQAAVSPGETQLRFMDGPYWITARTLEDSRVLLRCIEDRCGGGVVLEAEVGKDELMRELLRLASEVTKACADAAIESPDVTELRRYLREF